MPLPPGPLGHLRGLDAETIATVAPLGAPSSGSGGGSGLDDDGGSRGRRGAGQYLVAWVAIACFATVFQYSF